MRFVEPEYCVPGGQAVMSRLEMCYDNCVKSLRKNLGGVAQVAFTTYRWTAPTAESYMTVICHYIENWELRSAVLHTENIALQHAAENIAEKLHSVVERWSLTGRVLACLHDNTSNVQANVPKHVTWESISCFTHTLQLAINDGFSSCGVACVVAAANRLVAHFHHCSMAAEALVRKQAKLQVKQHCLIQSCSGWMSVHNMFERLCEQRWAITAVLSDSSVTKPSAAQKLQMPDEHWQFIEDILPLLSTLKFATTALTAEQSFSISDIYPICNSLLQTHLRSGSPAENGNVANFKAAVRHSLEHCMKPSDPAIAAKAALIASVLDPRHKHMQFLSPVLQATAKSKLLQLASPAGVEPLQSAGTEPIKNEVAEANELTEPTPKQMCEAKSAIVMLLGEDYSVKGNVENAVENELNTYFREPCPSLECNPLAWWKVNAQRFPTLGKLAQSYLCVPASSIPAESMFPNAGFTENCLFTRLTAEHVNMLIFLNKNQHYFLNLM
ncbi:hypothetical protein NDU88_006792 [Pleurodeles waltl]|uniref:HAT C-terminal dimerisation domain-containing protein n=2 Tax=Pleurodeles waltl TaxID=8319 RepID=A0AAV7PRP0_PLEWA|nr:hypothetical protein NDU88_006792 [Pleurodeles waltl]